MFDDIGGGKSIDAQHEEHSRRKGDYYDELWGDFEKEEKAKALAIAEEILALKKKIKSYEELFKRSLREIAESNKDFKKTYDKQQQLWAEWVIEKLAYKETAIQIGIKAGMTLDQIKTAVAHNCNAVIKGGARHVPNACDEPFLAAHAAAILEIFKKNGKV